MPTLPQDAKPREQRETALTERLSSVNLTEVAIRRLRLNASMRRVPMGRILSELVIEHLPEIKEAA